MIVRIATAKDIVPISQLLDEFFRFNHSQQPLFCADVKESGQYPKSVIDGATGDFFVADIDNAIVGFVHVEEDKTPQFPSVVQHKFACITAIYVTPEYRKRGVGKALLEKVKEWALVRNLEYLELFILAENETGKSFYSHENFTTASHTMRYML